MIKRLNYEKIIKQGDITMSDSMDVVDKASELKSKNKKLKKKLKKAKELLKFYYSRYEFCGTSASPNWKVKEDTEKLLKNEKKNSEYSYPNKYSRSK